MSDRFGLKVKENAGKTKYSSLNLNQTYKGTKVETKTSTGAARHGLQSLGKVGASRRIPPPANLPSLKSENSGNDPTVSLVPSGGGGWGSAKEKTPETPSSQTPPSSSTPSQANAPNTRQPLLQPQRPTAPPSLATQQVQPQPQSQNSGQTQTQPVKQQQEVQAKTWGNVSSNGAGGPGRSYSHQQMPYFNQEFPVLGGGGNSAERPVAEEKNHVQLGPKPMIRNTHEPAWMERSGSGPPPPPPPEYMGGRDRTEMYNGGQGGGYMGGAQHRRPMDYQTGHYPKSYPHGLVPAYHSNGPPAAHSHGSGPGGRPPQAHPPDLFPRGPVQRPGPHPGPTHSGNRPTEKGRGEGYGRPTILKPEDIQAMADNEEEEEGGWAGVQEEVDYGAKLDFEDFEDDEKPNMVAAGQRRRDCTAEEPEKKFQSHEGRFEKDEELPCTKQAWAEPSSHPTVHHDNRQGPPSGMRPFDSRGSPPVPGWPMPYTQQLPPQQRPGPPGHPPHSEPSKPMTKGEEPAVNEWQKRRVKQQEEMRAAVERARRRREDEEIRRQMEQKAAAMAKLKQLELKRVRKESSKEGDDDAWAAELDSIEKDTQRKEPTMDTRPPESLERDAELENGFTNQGDDIALRFHPLEIVNRQRNDSESSDASRNSRGSSRSHHHPTRDIPPRFQQHQQQQQFRQQQQQFQQQQYYHQHPQAYQQQHQYHPQHLSRSPQYRDFPEGPLTVTSHQTVVGPGPPSPSQPLAKADPPVRRIMRRSDSSSTAGDDVASVKSLESVGAEPIRESDKKQAVAPGDGAQKIETNSGQKVDGSQRNKRSDAEREKRDTLQGEQEVPVFDQPVEEEQANSSNKQHSDRDNSQQPGFQKEKLSAKEKAPERKERRGSIDRPSRSVAERDGQTRGRRDDRRNSKRDFRQQDNRRDEDNREFGKRKRDDSDDGAFNEDRKVKMSGRVDSKREHHTESRGRGRVSFPVRGRGRGMGSYRGRGRGDYRGNQDSRDYRESRPARTQEPKPTPAVRETKDEQKRTEEKENDCIAPNSTVTTVTDHGKIVFKRDSEVTYKEIVESGVLPVVKPEVETIRPEVETTSEEPRKEETDLSKTGNKTVVENRDVPSKIAEKDVDKSKTKRDPGKGQESYKELNYVTSAPPKGRGGFSKPPPLSQDSKRATDQDRRQTGKRFTDRRRTTQEKGRDQNADYDQRRSNRNFNKDQANRKPGGRDFSRTQEKDRGSDSKRSFHDDNREGGNRRPLQDDRRRKTNERDDDRQYSKQRTDDRNQRGSYHSFSTRGRFGRPSTRGGSRGGKSSQPVGSGRFGASYGRPRSSDEESSDDDYTDSESSSYTTATSASEERRDEKMNELEKESEMNRGKSGESTQEKPRLSSRSVRSPIRGKSSPRGGGRGVGGFGRSKREVERPPRFQRQQERERAGTGRGFPRGVRQTDARDSGPGRGRGRGRGRGSQRERPPKESSLEPEIPATEDWDKEVGDSVKETEPSKSNKAGERRDSAPRRGFPPTRTFSDRPRKDNRRESGGTRSTSSRRESFLAERQQAKVDGSKSASGEPQVRLPAAKNVLNKDGTMASHGKKSEKPGVVYNGVDNFNMGVDTRGLKKPEQAARKTDIQQYDLHNFAGVFCIDDMTDDDSDISSTLSGFVEVTSRRTQKENKDRLREEEERRKKDEHNRQRGTQTGGKKNQSSKPPRFSKQHTATGPPTKSASVIGKIASTFVSEVNTGAPSGGGNSNASSTNSTKRNSPVNVERPLSPPPPPPVFNAWNKPLIVTPAKPPSATPVVTSSVPDPLAVGSGKPSSTRPVQLKTVISSSTAALIEDKSVDDDYIAMTKEIALLAPPEEPEEQEQPEPSQSRVKRDQMSGRTGKGTDTAEKKSQSKPHREKPPRFERGTKRRPASGKEETKKEQSGGSKMLKSSSDGTSSQSPPVKGDTENISKKKVAASEKKGPSAVEQSSTYADPSRREIESDVKPTEAAEVSTTSDQVNEVRENVKQEIEEHDVKGDSESESSRKDSEPDLNVDSGERNGVTDNLFTSSTLSVDIRERPAADRPEREPSPVSPAFAEMTKNLEASRRIWEVQLPAHPMPSNSMTWDKTLPSVNSLGMSVVESSDDAQVPASKSQAELDVASSKADSKTSDSGNFVKKPGEQQNVCKVKPQQQQPVKPQQTSASVPQTVEENRQPELNTVPLSQPLLTQDHLLQQQALSQHLAYTFPFVEMQHRQPFLQQQTLQQLQQQTNQQVTPAFPLTHVQPVNQGRSSSSPLSQTPQDMYPSSFLAGNVYPAGSFQGSQPFVSIALLPETTTQSFASTTTRTQTSSLIGIQTQPPKTANTSVFGPNITPSGSQAMFMQFDPQALGGGAPLFNLTQQPQPTQRHVLGAQTGIMGDSVTRQGGFPTNQQTHQPFARTYPFPQKLSTFEVSQDMPMHKTPEQATSDFNRQSELAKHINAKPFEPPKRSTPSSMASSTAVMAGLVRSPNMIPLRPSPPTMGASSQSPPVSNSLISGRPMSMSPVDPNVPFPGPVGTFSKHTAVGQYHLQQQPQALQPQQFTPFQRQPVGIQQTLQMRPQGQQQQQSVSQLPGAATAILSNSPVVAAAIPRHLIRSPNLGSVGMTGTQPAATGAQRFPGPIQRPMQASMVHGVPHVPSPRGPRPQTAPVQMAPMKPQMVQTRPQIQSMPPPPPPPPPLQQNAASMAFKSEEKQKMLQQTRMFFAQQEQQQQQQRAPQHNTLIVDKQPKMVAPVTITQGNKPTVNPQMPSENQKPPEKKEETRSHIIELNPRMRKPTSEQATKTSKITKPDSKPEDSSKEKIFSKQDGKGTANKRDGPVRIQPLPQQRALQQRNRPNPNRSRGPPRIPGALQCTSKPKISGRTEKETIDKAMDQPLETQSPKIADQAKVSETQSA